LEDSAIVKTFKLSKQFDNYIKTLGSRTAVNDYSKIREAYNIFPKTNDGENCIMLSGIKHPGENKATLVFIAPDVPERNRHIDGKGAIQNPIMWGPQLLSVTINADTGLVDLFAQVTNRGSLTI